MPVAVKEYELEAPKLPAFSLPTYKDEITSAIYFLTSILRSLLP
jgi:hypothetical protein